MKKLILIVSICICANVHGKNVTYYCDEIARYFVGAKKPEEIHNTVAEKRPLISKEKWIIRIKGNELSVKTKGIEEIGFVPWVMHRIGDDIHGSSIIGGFSVSNESFVLNSKSLSMTVTDAAEYFTWVHFFECMSD